MSNTETVSSFSRDSLLKTLAIALQFGLVIVAIFEFNLISRSFLEMSILALGGFVIHSLLPRQFRLQFFLALSIGALFLVLGTVPALWILGIGAVLLAVALAPIPYTARVVILLVLGGALLYMRGPNWEGPIPAPVWPILGSIFMFRLIILVYDLQHSKERPPLKWILSYIFLLPNPCFPLFPVVDFKKMQSSYYNADGFSIYQKGVKWIYRGAVQLILYRFVYTRLTIDPVDVNSAADFVRFALTSFLLYLRVSGQFHLIVGMLLLFGFNLPETHHRYYLASSFNDFWRRINIYWKDFMMKLFYYPAYFKLRRWGDKTALVGATLFVFISTWFLHLYQWYWLRGTMLLEWHDVLFWTVLGLLVVWNSLHEIRFGRERATTWAMRSALGNASLVFKTAATFVVICLLWSMWTADSMTQWLELINAAGRGGIVIFLTGPALYAISYVLRRLDTAKPSDEKPKARLRVVETPFWKAAASNTVACLILAAIGSPAVYSYLGSKPAQEIAALTESQLSSRDQNRLERGYYEQLMGANRHSTELWELYNRRPLEWPRIQQTEIWRPHTENILLGELRPNQSIDFKNATLNTNRWGMRDVDYELEKPEDTFRIAVLGSSHVMGSGVNDGETFEAILERRLNSGDVDRPYSNYEVMNFAVAARSAVQHVYLVEEKVMPFKPDVVLHVAHGQDRGITVRFISRMVQSGVEIPYEYLRDLFNELGIDHETPDFIIQRRVKPRAGEILTWAYQRMADDCKEAEIDAFWVYLPMIYDPASGIALAEREKHAEEVGFSTISLAEVYESHDQSELQIAPWDNHPNAQAHALVADLLYTRMMESHLASSLEGSPRSDSTTEETGDETPPEGIAK
jgi:hypothetical protein